VRELQLHPAKVMKSAGGHHYSHKAETAQTLTGRYRYGYEYSRWYTSFQIAECWLAEK
jgi:hypothetical protein